MNNLHIGCHLSSGKGFYAMGKDALKINADTFQFFTRNPRGSKAKDLDLEDVKKLRILMEENHFSSIVAHAPYTLNPCSATEKTRIFASEIMTDDLSRMEYLPNQYYNLHPGSHTGQGIETGILETAEMLNKIIKPEQTTIVLLETMSGKGTEIGSHFEELAEIISKIKLKEKIGVCLDTCHIFDGGYDIVNHLDKIISDFDKIIGLNNLKAIHLNDSMNTLGSHKDRHACIGKGNIGIEAIKRIIHHPKLSHLPFILETPNDLKGHGKEIELLKS
ncbi:MAG: deoxyribonuclease IV [Prolixibacteraceae bacterium]|nr:deoxyribonuclease IV [Prolixibacteraceae bacterium]